MDPQKAAAFSDQVWEDSIVPELVEYIKIPNKSPHFDPQWAEHGHMDRAVAQIERWCRAQALAGLTVEVARLEGRTPVIFMEVPGTGDDTVLLYGHGHAGVALTVMNNVQFLEPTMVSPAGASGGFLADGRPATYRAPWRMDRRIGACS